jgi:dolichyl-phosphate-mannose--protein O-mannosyl transferase
LNLTPGIRDQEIGHGFVEGLISGIPTIIFNFNGRGKDHRQIYLIGNPAVWWTSSFAIAIYLVLKGISVLRWQRGYKDYDNRMSVGQSLT